MSVMVTPTARNAVTRGTVVALVCDVCRTELTVTTLNDCRLPMMAQRAAVAHEAVCGRPEPVRRPACGQTTLDGWECIADAHVGDAHYFVRADG